MRFFINCFGNFADNVGNKKIEACILKYNIVYLIIVNLIKRKKVSYEKNV